MDHLLEQANRLLQNTKIQWAFCGGYALDLFLNKETRKHSDIDICVFENDREMILDYMLFQGWKVYQFLGGGKVRPVNTKTGSDSGRNFMCVKDGCRLVQFSPSEEKGTLGHEFYHVGMERFDYLEFLFNCKREDNFVFNLDLKLTRKMEKAILYNNGFPYLAPELALLYKSCRADNPEYQYDYEVTVPHLSDEQLIWFHNGLEKLYPEGHPWNKGIL